MKFAVSNIAWPIDQDDDVARILLQAGFSGIEIAPTKYFPDPSVPTRDDLHALRQAWIDRGLPIVAAQALLFGKPDLTIFDSAEIRQRTLNYLCGVIRTCGLLGAKALVFGSPKNRRVGDNNRLECEKIATAFFLEIARAASDAGTVVVMEANPPAYGADFITRASEAAAIVRQVDHPGFRLHLDVACMSMAGDDVSSIITSNPDIIHHAHISEPNLAPIDGSNPCHTVFRTALTNIQYTGWCSVEMRQIDPFEIELFRRILCNAIYIYQSTSPL